MSIMKRELVRFLWHQLTGTPLHLFCKYFLCNETNVTILDLIIKCAPHALSHNANLALCSQYKTVYYFY